MAMAAAEGSHGFWKQGRDILMSRMMREVSLSGESAVDDDASGCSDAPWKRFN